MSEYTEAQILSGEADIRDFVNDTEMTWDASGSMTRATMAISADRYIHDVRQLLFLLKAERTARETAEHVVRAYRAIYELR